MIERIRTRDAFLRLRREGRRVRVGLLWCTYLPDPELTPPAVGFALGRAVGNAVTRNRLRRRLRAILAGSDVPPGLIAIGAAPGATELTYEELAANTARLLEALTRGAART